MKSRWDLLKSGCLIPVTITPVAGSIFGGPELVSKAIFSNWFSKTRIRVPLYGHPIDITGCFCGVDSLILPLPELELSIDTLSLSLF